MKKHSYYLVVLFLFSITVLSCSNNKNQNEKITTSLINNPITASGDYSTDGLPKIAFEKEVHDFGIIIEGEKVSYTFKFKNIGKSDLIIKEAKASCGCTVPKYPHQPIAPGEEGSIEVIFDSGGRTGRQSKTITVWTNCQPNQSHLEIVSEIVEPKK